MIAEALMLGLSSGTYCSMYCSPVLIPFLAGTNKTGYKRNALLLGVFLLCRLVMYFALSFILYKASVLVSSFYDPVFGQRLSPWAYLLTGTFLLLNVIYRQKGGKNHCSCSRTIKLSGNDFSTAAFTGLGVGLHICPPLWTAMFMTVAGNFGKPGMFYLVFFYIGSLVYFIPLLGIPFFTKRFKVLKRVSFIASLLVALYFIIFDGLIAVFFG